MRQVTLSYRCIARTPRQLKMHCIHAFLVVSGAALLLMPGLEARAELVQARLEGVVSPSQTIPALNGQPWVLTFVYDTEAPDSNVFPTPNQGVYSNAGPVKALRALDFSVGSSGNFEIHLVDPVPGIGFDNDVRIDVDNFGSKGISVHVDNVALFPTWNGLQLDDFLLVLNDPTPGGFADGTDRLPSADPAITFADFAGGLNAFRLDVGPTGQLNFAISSFALTAVPEVSPGGLCAAGGLAALVLKRRRRFKQAGGGAV